jgi:hypothetical protein
MSKLKELEKELVVLRSDKEKLVKKDYDVEVKKTIELGEMYSKYFSGCLIEGDTIISNLTSFEIRRDHPELSYQKDVMNVYFRNSNYRNTNCDEINLSFYSTSTNDDFELNRMVLIGDVGRIVLDYRDDIIGEYNLINDKWKEETSERRSDVWDIDKLIGEKIVEIDNLTIELIERDLENGITLDDSRGVNIQIGFNDVRKGIKSVTKVGETSSGKSVKLKMTLEYDEWDVENSKWGTVEYEKPETLVRRNYYNDFLWSIEKLKDKYKVNI